MTRIIIAMLFTLTIAGPVWAEGEVLLHCNGDWRLHSADGKQKNRRDDVATIKMAQNGEWMEIGGERSKRTTKGLGNWLYWRDEGEVKIHFTVDEMKFFFAAKSEFGTIYRYLNCFPITNPFLKYVE